MRHSLNDELSLFGSGSDCNEIAAAAATTTKTAAEVEETATGRVERSKEGETEAEGDCLVDEALVRWGIKALRAHRDACAAKGKYADAKTAHGKIKELENYLIAVVTQRTKGRHLLQQAAVEEAHFNEIRKLSSALKRSNQTFEAHAKRLHAELRRRHLEEMAKCLEASILSVQPRIPHWSSQLLKLRKYENIQAKAHKYDAAARIQAVADKIERQEYCEWKQQRDAAVGRRHQLLQQRQQRERDSLEARLAAAREQLRGMHADALCQLRRRYLYLKSQTTRSQHLESVRIGTQMRKAAEKKL